MQLDDGEGGVVVFSDDLEWTDQYEYTPVSQTVSHSLDGAQIIQEAQLQAGRTVTLVSGAEVWVDKSVVDGLYSLLVAGKTMTLTLADESTMEVVWNHSQEPLKANPVRRQRKYESTTKFTLKLALLEI